MTDFGGLEATVAHAEPAAFERDGPEQGVVRAGFGRPGGGRSEGRARPWRGVHEAQDAALGREQEGFAARERRPWNEAYDARTER